MDQDYINDYLSQTKHVHREKKVYFVYIKEANYTLLAFVGIFLIVISEWPPLSHRLLWFMVSRVLSDRSVNRPHVGGGRNHP